MWGDSALRGADYTRYRDHWVAYAMNKMTRYIHLDDYDTFALRNAQVNLDFLYKRETLPHLPGAFDGHL